MSAPSTMSSSVTPVRHARSVAEIDRLGIAGLDGLDLLRRLTQILRPLVPFDAYCATTTDPASNLITDAIAERESPGADAAAGVTAGYFSRVYFEHDLGDTLGMLRAGQRVRRLSDVTNGDLTRSGRYRLHLRPRHLGPEIYATFVDRGLWGELHLTREQGSRDFSDQEIELVQHTVPSIASGLKFAALRARSSTVTTYEATDAPGVLILDHGGRVVSSTPNVAGFLRDLGVSGAGVRGEGDLPIAVQVVLAALERAAASTSGDGRRVPRLRVRAASGRWLTLDASLTEPTGDRGGERVVVIGPAVSEEIAWLSMSAYELSPREEEVVRLVVHGLATRQIADQLFITEHTVQRHLSNIFEKVGVRSRRDLVKRLFVDQVLPSLN